jgi:hypothetical protein
MVSRELRGHAVLRNASGPVSIAAVSDSNPRIQGILNISKQRRDPHACTDVSLQNFVKSNIVRRHGVSFQQFVSTATVPHAAPLSVRCQLVLYLYIQLVRIYLP